MISHLWPIDPCARSLVFNWSTHQAPFTRVRTNFCTDEFCTWSTCLHGTVQILLQIAIVFTRVRANFETSLVSAMIGSSFCSQPITLLLMACGKSKMATSDKNYTWTNEDVLNLLLHVVLDYIKKRRRRRWLDHSEKQVRRSYEKVFWEVERKGQISPRFRRTKLQRRAHPKQIKKDQVNGKVAERRQLLQK